MKHTDKNDSVIDEAAGSKGIRETFVGHGVVVEAQNVVDV
jgi:hypothetical protein